MKWFEYEYAKEGRVLLKRNIDLLYRIGVISIGEFAEMYMKVDELPWKKKKKQKSNYGFKDKKWIKQGLISFLYKVGLIDRDEYWEMLNIVDNREWGRDL